MILILIVLGFIFYRLKPYKFTGNSIVIMNLLHNELDNLEGKLLSKEISESERKITNERINEIKYTLKQFYGTVV